ncbi:MAG: transposase [Actinobacteria bacterium]|nr:transposase [Actinomycetota bacterium]
MARLARIVSPDFPHHIIQRGNRRQDVFFKEQDYENYLNLLQAHSRQFSLEILAYCLMTNHIHIIAIPKNADSLSRAIGETHRKYTNLINKRNKWTGYLWQGRFSSYILDEPYLFAALKYMLYNPVRAKLCKNPWEYKWSSARYYIIGEDKPNSLLKKDFFNSIINDWKEFLTEDITSEEIKLLQKHENTGRPLGNSVFVEKLEKVLNRNIKKKKPGPKLKRINN